MLEVEIRAHPSFEDFGQPAELAEEQLEFSQIGEGSSFHLRSAAETGKNDSAPNPEALAAERLEDIAMSQFHANKFEPAELLLGEALHTYFTIELQSA